MTSTLSTGASRLPRLALWVGCCFARVGCCFALVCCLALTGCQKGMPEGRVVAKGVIQLPDGKPLTGTAGMVTFCPIDPDHPQSDAGLHAGNLPGKRCVGWIKPDGTFELATNSQGDGAEAAHYKVFLNVDNIAPGPPRVPLRYTEYLPSPWVVKIEPSVENFFELALEAPKR